MQLLTICSSVDRVLRSSIYNSFKSFWLEKNEVWIYPLLPLNSSEPKRTTKNFGVEFPQSYMWQVQSGTYDLSHVTCVIYFGPKLDTLGNFSSISITGRVLDLVVEKFWSCYEFLVNNQKSKMALAGLLAAMDGSLIFCASINKN